jgi:hypothetical protein
MKHFSMKAKLALALAVVATFVSASVFASGRGPQDFTLHNRTGVEIYSLYVSPHESNAWEEDILGRDTLPNGEDVKITFDDRDKHEHWDLKVTDKDNNSLEWTDLNLTEISEVTIHWDAKKKKGWADVK